MCSEQIYTLLLYDQVSTMPPAPNKPRTMREKQEQRSRTHGLRMSGWVGCLRVVKDPQ